MYSSNLPSWKKTWEYEKWGAQFLQFASSAILPSCHCQCQMQSNYHHSGVISSVKAKSFRYKKFGAQFCISASVPVAESSYHHISGVQCPPTQRGEGCQKESAICPSVWPQPQNLPSGSHTSYSIAQTWKLGQGWYSNLQWDLSWDDNYAQPGNWKGERYTDRQLALVGARVETQLCLAQ